MITAAMPQNEEARLSALAHYDIFDTPPETSLDEIVLLAAQIGQAPIALLTFLDATDLWVKARFGCDVETMPRGLSFCSYTILQDTPLIITDVRHDEFFRSVPVDSRLHDIRFYAGVPLVTPQGHALGALCLMDRFPRTLAPRARQALVLLARQVLHQLEMRRTLRETVHQHQDRQQQQAGPQQDDGQEPEERRDGQSVALAVRESYYRSLFEENPGPLYVYDPNGCIVTANAAAAGVLGYAPRELEGRNLSEFLAPVWRRRAAARLGTLQPGLACVVTKNGEFRWVRYDTTPMSGAEAPPLMAGSLTDITDIVRLQRALRRERNQARFAVLAKSNFLANMSHEIRTPMNGIIGMANLLADSELNDAQREYVDLLRDGADNLITYINDILDLSKIEAGMMSLERVDFDLSGVVENTVKMFAGRAYAKGLEMVTQIANDVPRLVRGDPGRLRQVINNLISNAIKFTEHGEIVVKVEARPRATGRVELRFTVSDTGVGIPADFLPRLYDSYTQAGLTPWRYLGTGLGLSISKQLVEMMSGSIEVESEVGCGSAFRFSVEMEESPAIMAHVTPPGDLRGLRVLVVDDNDASRHILRQQTTSWGMVSREADSAAAALEELKRTALEDRKFDVAIIDWEMPDMDGIELARRIKSEPALASLPLILLSSFGWRGQAKVARDAGLSAYLTKPIRQAQLFECLVTVLGISAADSTAEPAAKPLVTRHNLKDYTPLAQQYRILLAEDNVVNQQVAVHQLYKLGYTADVVANGREALAALVQHDYDLVFMDCQMPEMDGYEAATEIRRREAGQRHTVIVAMTGNAFPEDREKCLAFGMDDYLQKPIKHPVLKEMLERWLTPATDSGAETAPPATETTEPVAAVAAECAAPDFLTAEAQPATPDAESGGSGKPETTAGEESGASETSVTDESGAPEPDATDDTASVPAAETEAEQETAEAEGLVAGEAVSAGEELPVAGEVASQELLVSDAEAFANVPETEALPLVEEIAVNQEEAEAEAHPFVEEATVGPEAQNEALEAEPASAEDPFPAEPEARAETADSTELPAETEIIAVMELVEEITVPAPETETLEEVTETLEEITDTEAETLEEVAETDAETLEEVTETDAPAPPAAEPAPLAAESPALAEEPASNPEPAAEIVASASLTIFPADEPGVDDTLAAAANQTEVTGPAPAPPPARQTLHAEQLLPFGSKLPEPVIDLSVLARLLSRDGKLRPDLAVELIDLFLQDADTHLATLQRAWEQRDTKALLQTTHSLKSSSASMGAKRLSALCENFHRQVSYQQYNFAEMVRADLLPELEQVCQALRAERNRLAT